jgi:hypothetical protein
MARKIVSSTTYYLYKHTAKRHWIRGIFKRHFLNWLATLPPDEFRRATYYPSRDVVLEFLKKYEQYEANLNA